MDEHVEQNQYVRKSGGQAAEFQERVPKELACLQSRGSFHQLFKLEDLDSPQNLKKLASPIGTNLSSKEF